MSTAMTGEPPAPGTGYGQGAALVRLLGEAGEAVGASVAGLIRAASDVAALAHDDGDAAQLPRAVYLREIERLRQTIRNLLSVPAVAAAITPAETAYWLERANPASPAGSAAAGTPQSPPPGHARDLAALLPDGTR